MLRKTGFGLVSSVMVLSFLFPVIVFAQCAAGEDCGSPALSGQSAPSDQTPNGQVAIPSQPPYDGSTGDPTVLPSQPGSTGDPTVLPSTPGSNPSSLSGGSVPSTPGSNPSVLPRFTSFQNPISANTIQDFIARILQFVVQLSVPFAVFFIILTGFRYVMAQGNPEKILEAHRTLLYTVIGIMVLLGAQLISLVIQNTIQQLR